MKIFIIVLFLLITIFMYLVIVGGNITKTAEEREIEREEELRFLDNYKNRKRQR